MNIISPAKRFTAAAKVVNILLTWKIQIRKCFMIMCGLKYTLISINEIITVVDI